MHSKPVFTALITAGSLILSAGHSLRAAYAEEATSDVASNARIVVRYERGRVDITAENAPFTAVVAKLSAALNIPMEIKGPSPGPVTLRLRDMSVEAALKALSRNLITIYDDSGKKLKKAILIAEASGPNTGQDRGAYQPPEARVPPTPAPPPDPAQPERGVDPPATPEVASPQTEAEEP